MLIFIKIEFNIIIKNKMINIKEQKINFPNEVLWKGPTITLRTPVLEDSPIIRNILSDIHTMKDLRFMTREPSGWSLDDVKKRLQTQLNNQKEKKALVVHIIYNNKIIGMSGFTMIDIINKNAEIGIIIDKKYWGKNIASEVYYLCLKFAFEELNLHRIQWVTTEQNKGMRGWLEKICNIQVEAIIKDIIILDDKFISNYIYAMFEEDWNNRIKKILEKRIYKN
jgi:RimJ/RimL family protein N-acetyltransferase